MATPHRYLAEQLRRCTEALMARRNPDEILLEAGTAAERLATDLETGPVRPLEDRSQRFVDQMLGRELIADGEPFEPFAESPVSGSLNPLSASTIRIERISDSVTANVMIGVAMEGAPGRAHGGFTAALFDDVMGALQLVIGKSGYTKSLHIEYLAMFPVGEPVEVTANEIPADDGHFAVAATASSAGKEVARATGVFTLIDRGKFARVKGPGV